MLEVYLYNDNCIYDNDLYFNKHTYASLLTSEMRPFIIDIIKGIDDCTIDFVNHTVSNKLGQYVDITKLSLGCKTALNIFLNENLLFYGAECGQNALDVIFEFTWGKVYLPTPPRYVSTPISVKYLCHVSRECTKEGSITEIMGWYNDNRISL